MRVSVIGGGPAGLSAAIALKKLDHDVQVFDQNTPAPRRVCGSFLSPEAMRHLDWLKSGDIVREKATPIHLTEIFTDRSPHGASIKEHDAWMFARPELESILIKQAGDLGVEFMWRHRVEETLAADITIIAAGKSYRAKKSVQAGGWYGFNATFENVRQPPGIQSMHFMPRGYLGIGSYRNGTTNVCGLVMSDFAAELNWQRVFDIFLDRCPSVSDRMQGSRRIDPWQGVGPLPFGSSNSTEAASIRVGDAAGVADPFMGEGIARALAAGPMLHRNFEDYARRWRQSYAKRFLVAKSVRSVIAKPWLFRSIAPFLANGLRTPLAGIFHSTKIGKRSS